MGTDIHFYVESRDGDKWVSRDTWSECEYDPGRLSVRKPYYDGRNYDLFAILADVRNGRGFAGIQTGEGFNPISAPKGLPDDLSPELRAEAEAYLEHTPSWLTVAEIMSHDWTQTTTKYGVVDAGTFERWERWKRGNGFGPEEWCGGISGPNIRMVSEDEMRQEIANAKKSIPQLNNDGMKAAILQALPDIYCRVSWGSSYSRAASEFLSETLPRLWRLGKPEDVRCVFWFDS